nr:MAG TPA: hypothetical protein [Bacteriophage sp.]
MLASQTPHDCPCYSIGSYVNVDGLFTRHN